MKKLQDSFNFIACRLVLFVFLWIPFLLSAQNDSSKINSKRVWLVSSIHAVGYAGSTAALASIWYNDFAQAKLHAFNDLDQWGGMDKVGHANTAWQLANFSFTTFHWAGIPSQKAALLGSGFSLFYLTTLEFFDGYSAEWGFSFSDMGANLVGSSLAYFRNTGKLQHLQFKWSYWPGIYPDYRPEVLGSQLPEQMLKDYNGQTYWLSVNMPQKWFSEDRGNWLCFSLGYSIDGYTGGKQNYTDPKLIQAPVFKRNSEFFLSVDVDFLKLNIKNKWLKQLAKVFNVVKFPAPAVGFSTGGKLLIKPFGF